MVTDLLVSAVLAALDAVLSLLPIVALPAVTVLGWADDFAAIVSGVHGVVPIGDVLVLLSLAVAVMFAFAVFDLAVWTYHQFWGAS